MKSNGRKLNLLVLVLLLCFNICLFACNKPSDDNNDDDGEIDIPPTEPVIEANVTESTFLLLEGTDYETTGYRYVTDKEGPKIIIIGGIHGDEVAGWTAGLRLVETIKEEKGICGEIIIVPQANILADKAKKRYAVTGHEFSDLNRSFPLDRYSNAKAETLTISNAIVKLVEDFDADYIIDLHESRNSWTEMESGTTTSLGDTIVNSNSRSFTRKIVDRYNKTYLLEDETDFRIEEANQKGSFNYYFTNTYKDKVVFTIETNRGYKNGNNTIGLEKRVRQQLNMLKALFDIAWERI